MNKPLILVVEDDPSVRNLITTTLRLHEYRFLTAASGSGAILEASSHNPDVVLLDLGLPDMDGVEVIQRIRTWSNMPIIVISARSDDTDKIEALDAGADDYLTKPFSVEELLARLRVTQRRLSYMTPVLQGIVWTGTMLIGLIGLALVQGLPTSETELIIPYIVKNFVVSFNPVLAKILMVAFFIGASAVGLSTSNAFLSVASAIVADDLLRNTFHMDLSGKKGVNANRIIIAVLGIGSMLLALDPPELIFTLIMSLFPVLVLGIYWKKATKQAAIVSSIVGTVLVLATYFVWNIGGTWYGAIGMLGSTVCMVVVSLFTKQDSKDSEAFFAALKNGMNRSYKIEDKAVAAQAGMSTED